MKQFLFSLLGVLILNSTIGQNTLDKVGLGSSTPAAVAYSLRLLSSSYAGPAIQVRRSSDDATLDIYFTTDGDLDSVTLKTFTSAADGYVTIWYDQSGNGRNLIKTDVNYQPKIVFNGSLKYIGSRVTVDFLGDKGLVYSGGILNLYSISTVIKSESPYWPSFHSILDGTPRIGGILWTGGTSFWQDAPQLAIWKNGISKTTSESLSPVDEAMILSYSSQTYSVNQLSIGNYDGGGSGGSILETEAIAFPALLSDSDRKNVECSQGFYYSIVTGCTVAITSQPSPAVHAECMGSAATPLAIQVTGFNLTYQWYSNSVASNTGGTLISGATSNTFSPPTTSLGTTYYYVVVTGSVGSPVTSDVSGAVTIDNPPTVSVSPLNPIIHQGDSVTLTASGASIYLWGADNSTPLDHTSNYKLAVGLRRLRNGYTGSALRLRRSSDNVESDFGFIGNELDITSINTFLGTSDGYCTILYDQSGFGNNVVQSNTSQQPLFVVNGLNGKPVLRFAPGISMTNTTNFPPPYSVIYSAKQTGPSRGRVLAAVYNNWLLGWWNGSMSQAFFEGWVSQGGGIPADSNPYVYSGTCTGSISSLYQNGTLLNSNGGGLSGPNGISLNGSESSDADIAEVFVFDAVLPDVERKSIENSSGSYYSIFGQAPVPGASYTVSPTATTTYTVTGYSANGGCAVPANSVVTVLNNPNLTNFNSLTKNYYDHSYVITPPTSNSTGAFTYTSSNTSVATISGVAVNIVGAGTTTITATQADDANYYSDTISATLTVRNVSVVTKNGKITNTDTNYVSRNGAIASSSGVNLNGEIKFTLSNGDGLSAANPSTSAWRIKQDYPGATDGLYWITNPNINNGTPFQIYADMTTNGGGWTLIMCNKSPNTGWNSSNALLRNENNPDINADYSIIAWANYIKKDSSGFQYMIDANQRRSWGGIWTANQPYSFVSTSNTNIDITLNTKFGTWNYGDDGVEERMPWYAPGSQGIITTSTSADGNWWGTLIASGGWNPAPWMSNSGMPDPGIIWYWVR